MKTLYELNSKTFDGVLKVEDRAFDFFINKIGNERLADVIVTYRYLNYKCKGIELTLHECQQIYNKQGWHDVVPNWFYDKNLQLEMIIIIRNYEYK